MSIDEQIGRIVLAHQEGLEEGLKRHEAERQKSAATIAKLQAENAKVVADSVAKDAEIAKLLEDSAAKDARIKELEALLAQKG